MENCIICMTERIVRGGGTLYQMTHAGVFRLSYSQSARLLFPFPICSTVLNTKRVENAVFQSLDIFSVMVHAIETQ